MKKIIRLTESDLARLVKRVIKEHNRELPQAATNGIPSSYVPKTPVGKIALKGINTMNEFKNWVNENYPKLAMKLRISKNDPTDDKKLMEAFNYIIKKEDKVWDWMGNSSAEGQKLGEIFMKETTNHGYDPLKV